jgi:hypothetical protein
MRDEPFVEDALGVVVHRGEIGEVHRQRDARGSGVARERIDELVLDQGELRPVRIRSRGVGEAEEVPVIHRSCGRLTDLLGGADLGGDERRATVGADHDPRPDHIAAREHGAHDPVALSDERRDRGSFAELHARLGGRSPDQQVIERLASHREREPHVARILRWRDVRRRVLAFVVVVADELGTPVRQHLVEDTERVEHGAQTTAAEEMRRERGAGEPRSIHEEDPVSRSAQERGGDRPRDACADDQGVHRELHERSVCPGPGGRHRTSKDQVGASTPSSSRRRTLRSMPPA